MPKLTTPELDRIAGEYTSPEEKLTGERLYADADAQIFHGGANFDELTDEERFVFNAIAETAEEVFAETEEKFL